ncbi:MAG: hypothetical protein WCE73_11320 [Candidatus Angelobacter sp.]
MKTMETDSSIQPHLQPHNISAIYWRAETRTICGTCGTPNLTTCQSGLADQKAINSKQSDTIADQTKQIALKEDEIKALKKPKGFWKRLGSELKKATVYIGSATLAKVL